MHVLFAHKKQRARSKDFDAWRKQFALPARSGSGSEVKIQMVPEVNMDVVPEVQSSMDQQTNGESVTGKYTVHKICINIANRLFSLGTN